jgi:hypothetical protein
MNTAPRDTDRLVSRATNRSSGETCRGVVNF